MPICLLLCRIECHWQATQGFAPNRVHVWQLAGNVSVGGANCIPVNVSGATTLLGDEAASPSVPADTAPSMRQVPLNATLPASQNRSQLPAPANDSSSAPTAAARVYSLGFQYTVGLINIPADAPDRYFQVRNATLWQLPQGRTPSGHSGAGSTRRLLQEAAAPAAGSTVSLPTALPSGAFTILLWPFNRWAVLRLHFVCRAVSSWAVFLLCCLCQYEHRSMEGGSNMRRRT